jgi:hypothetical protein
MVVANHAPMETAMPNDINTLIRYFADQCPDSITRRALFNEALGLNSPYLRRIIFDGPASDFVINALAVVKDDSAALDALVDVLKLRYGADIQAEIEAMRPLLQQWVSAGAGKADLAAAAPRVFISYARKDGEAFATALRTTLSAQGIAVWQDRVGMEGGRDWWLQITDVLDKVDFMVLIMTPRAVESEIVRKEWRYARQNGVCVYPVIAAPNLDFNQLPQWMRKVHFYNLGLDTSAFQAGPNWVKFVADLRGSCNAPRVPFMAEDLPNDFIVRPEKIDGALGHLLDAKRENPLALTAALRGAGGYGKTTIAKAICHHPAVQEAFSDGILWVTLGENNSEADLIGKLNDLIYTLRRERSGAVGLDNVSKEFADLLAERSFLLVIDDVWNSQHLRPFLQGGKNCTRLITTCPPPPAKLT